MLKNFMNRSEQKTCACLSSNRKTCQLGTHCIGKKFTFNLVIAVGLAVRVVSSVQDLWLSPTRPGFDSRIGKCITFLNDFFFILTITLN